MGGVQLIRRWLYSFGVVVTFFCGLTYSVYAQRVNGSGVRIDGAAGVYASDGSVTSGGFAFVSSPGTGFYQPSAFVIGVKNAGTQTATFGTFGITAKALYLDNTNQDVVFRRSAAKTLTTDTDGASGALTLVDLIATTTRVQTLNATTAYQTNGTPGATHAACSTSVTAITVTNGLITAITCT